MLKVVYFSLAWLAIVYLFNCIFAKKIIRVDFKTALLYISTMTLIGFFGEVFIDSIYNFIFRTPLWQYHFLPIHNNFTSYYSLFIWTTYGFHLYLFHKNLKVFNIESEKTLAAIMGIEAIVIELLFNGSFFLIFKDYIFYYLPNDVWHLTSLQAIPFYFLAGLVIVRSLKRFSADPKFFILMSYLLLIVLVFLV